MLSNLGAGEVVFGKGEANETELISKGYNDKFLAKYNPDGTLAWARKAASSEECCMNSEDLAALPDGSTLMIGHFPGTAVFGPGSDNETELISAGEHSSNDVFIAKFGP